jgi:hypothetical protein
MTVFKNLPKADQLKRWGNSNSRGSTQQQRGGTGEPPAATTESSSLFSSTNPINRYSQDPSTNCPIVAGSLAGVIILTLCALTSTLPAWAIASLAFKNTTLQGLSFFGLIIFSFFLCAIPSAAAGYGTYKLSQGC